MPDLPVSTTAETDEVRLGDIVLDRSCREFNVVRRRVEIQSLPTRTR